MTSQTYRKSNVHSHDARVRELRRLRDRATLEEMWRRIVSATTCTACAHHSTDARCATCDQRGMRT